MKAARFATVANESYFVALIKSVTSQQCNLHTHTHTYTHKETRDRLKDAQKTECPPRTNEPAKCGRTEWPQCLATIWFSTRVVGCGPSSFSIKTPWCWETDLNLGPCSRSCAGRDRNSSRVLLGNWSATFSTATIIRVYLHLSLRDLHAVTVYKVIIGSSSCVESLMKSSIVFLMMLIKPSLISFFFPFIVAW